MIALLTILASEIFAVALLLYRGEIVFLQVLLFSQLWLVVVAIPFLLRAETRLGFFHNRLLQALTLVLLGAVFAGIQMKTQDMAVASYGGMGQALVGPLNEFLPVAGVIVVAAVFLASVILKEDR